MPLVTQSWMIDSLLFILTAVFLVYRYFAWKYSYFKDRNIPYLKPTPILGIKENFTMSQHEFAKFLYGKFPDERFYGFFMSTMPGVLVKDLDLIQQIMTKDFGHFHDRGFSNEGDPLSQNLFNASGHSWRILRLKLIPTFTTGKLKQIFDQLSKSGDSLLEDIDKSCVSKEPFDATQSIYGYTIEVIASVAFGLDFSRHSPQAKEFRSKISTLFNKSLRLLFTFFMLMFAPKVLTFFKISFWPPNVYTYLMNLTKATKEYRQQNNIKRNDYFQLLLSLQEMEEKGEIMSSIPIEKSEEDALIDQMDYVGQPHASQTESEKKLFTHEGITAQSFVFLTAGTETVSSTLSFTFYSIAKNPKIQAKIQEEVDNAVAKHGSFTYQAVRDMVYIDQVIQETQRMYSSVPILMRQCTVPFRIPDSDFVIEKGTIVSIPVLGLQTDPKYYPDPDTFDPDRFADNNYKPNSVFMPFGDGPRICIGMRFAILEMKVCIAKILSKYTVEINSKTQEPLAFDPKVFILRPLGGMWFDFKKRTKL